MEAKTDRRIKRTRYLLVHALTSLMLKKSIKDITVKELCESVDINRGTFYLHYKDIYDMLEQTEQGLLEQFEQVFKNYHPDHTPDFPYPLFVEIFQIIEHLLQIAVPIAYGSAFNGMDHLGSVEAEHGGISQRSDAGALIPHTKGMGGIIDDFQPAGMGDGF